MTRKQKYFGYKNGFTIVELLIVIVVIAILAVISIVVFSGLQKRANESALRSDISGSQKLLDMAKTTSGTYPLDHSTANEGRGLPSSGAKTTWQYTATGATSYCLTGTRGGVALRVSNSGAIQEGVCPGHAAPSSEGSGSNGGNIANGSRMQDVTSANCPETRTRVFDARDNHSYWVQKLSNGQCWMLTNLAYAGGGTNTYSDTKTMSNGDSQWPSYTQPYYYVTPSTTNFTTEPANPSTSTDGTGQYGYLYNWCAANGGQNTSACADASTPAVNTSISVCPSGWKLPATSNQDFLKMNQAVNSGQVYSSTGILTGWLGQKSGAWTLGFESQGQGGFYWSSSSVNLLPYALAYNSTAVGPGSSDYVKYHGFAVRCLAI